MRTLKILSTSLFVTMLVSMVVSSPKAHAATTPSLGAAATYGVLADTYTDTSGATTVNGDVGFTTGPATAIGGVHNNFGSGAPYATAGADQNSALSALAAQPCTFTFAPGPIDLSTDTTHGTIGVYAPGVYCSSGAMDVGGPLTLSGTGTYIFRPDGALTSTVGATVSLSGSSACDVFWTPTAATTFAANTTFSGTVIDNSGITVGANSTWLGRALAFGGTVTTDTDTITVPTCAEIVPPGGSAPRADLTVIKTVINDNGGTKTIGDFSLFVDGNGHSSVFPGQSVSFPVSSEAYVVSETPDPGYALTFSGDCDSQGRVILGTGDNKVCILTNDDIGEPAVVPVVPPLINVVKVPSPLSLPAGPGPVTYTYTLSNIGTVPVSNITMIGDTCSPIVRTSGDLNNNSILEVNEVWVHTCSTTLTETHTNTIVASGTANGLTAVDFASATVVVGAPTVPPLINVTKIPSTFTLLAGGGLVTYTERITNPGTVALSNIGLTDDKCGPMVFVSGDTDNDSQLDTTETWTYTCQTTLTATTTNTATASGQANGLTVRDFATATVVVAASVPTLPVAGSVSENNYVAWMIIVSSLLGASVLLYVLQKRKLA